MKDDRRKRFPLGSVVSSDNGRYKWYVIGYPKNKKVEKVLVTSYKRKGLLKDRSIIKSYSLEYDCVEEGLKRAGIDDDEGGVVGWMEIEHLAMEEKYKEYNWRKL